MYYTTLSIFSLSLVLIVFMILNKRRELASGKAFITLSGGFDHFVERQIFFLKKISTEFPKHFGREMLYSLVHKSVVFSHNFKEKVLRPKIGHIVDAVKGKHIPKQNGSSSFFLFHIQKHKDTKDNKEE